MNSNILELHESQNLWEGFTPIGSVRRPKDWSKRLANLHALIENHAGDGTIKWQAKFLEAMSTNDFPALFSDAIDRELLARYRAIAPVMRPVLKMATLLNFRTAKRFIQPIL